MVKMFSPESRFDSFRLDEEQQTSKIRRSEDSG